MGQILPLDYYCVDDNVLADNQLFNSEQLLFSSTTLSEETFFGQKCKKNIKIAESTEIE